MNATTADGNSDQHPVHSFHSLHSRLNLSLQELESIDLSFRPHRVMRKQLAHPNAALYERILTLKQQVNQMYLELSAERSAHQRTADALAAAAQNVELMQAKSLALEQALARAEACSAALRAQLPQEERLNQTGGDMNAEMPTGEDRALMYEEHAWQEAINRERRRCEKRDEQWGHRPSKADCLERFQQVMSEFSVKEYSKTAPVTDQSIPWPLLYAARLIQPQVINEDNIRAFFNYAKSVMSTQEYKKCLRTARIHFHPDKWTARNILQTLQPDLQDLVYNLITIVSQLLMYCLTRSSTNLTFHKRIHLQSSL